MKDKIRVQIANAPEDVNGVTWWRMFRPLRLLFDAHPDVEFRFNPGTIFPHDLEFADILFAFRPTNPDHPQVIAKAKEAGCKILLDYDDNLLDVPIGYNMYKDTVVQRQYVLQCLAMADTVFVSTETLKTTYSNAIAEFLGHLRRSKNGIPPGYGMPRMIVVPNAVLPEDVPSKPNGNTKVGLWRGADFHRDDIDSGRQQYERFIRNIKHFTWVGYMPTWGDVSHKSTACKIDYNFGIPAREWLNYLRSLKPAFMWKPLVDNKFNRSKTCISRLEITCAGGICITNFADTDQIWKHSASDLPVVDEYYSVLWRQSADDVLENYDLRRWNEVRYREILKLVNE